MAKRFQFSIQNILPAMIWLGIYAASIALQPEWGHNSPLNFVGMVALVAAVVTILGQARTGVTIVFIMLIAFGSLFAILSWGVSKIP